MGPELIEKVVAELDERLRAGIVSKVHQPDERDVYLRVFVRGAQELLLISTNPKYSRIHLTATKPVSPHAPKRFCAFLRSRINGAIIQKIGQVEGQRIVRIELKKGPEAFTLVAELTGKSGNIILLSAKGTVLDALKHFPVEGSLRAVVPGLELQPLPLARARAREEGLVPKPEGKNWNEAVEEFYAGLVLSEEKQKLKNKFRRTIRAAEKKVKKKLENLLGDRSKAEENIAKARFGEFLTANFAKLKRGMAEVGVVDYYKTPPVIVNIPLETRLNPKENVERYFKRARKAKTAIELLKKRIPLVERELEYIRGLTYELESAKSDEDMEGLFEELIEAGYLKEKPLTFGKKPVAAEPVRRFTSEEGFEILAGKSGPGNDLLVKKYAKEGDIWFHAKGAPGSHVLLKAKGRQKRPTEKAVEEAAAYAAYYSKNRTSAKAEVIYTDVKNVKKPRGGKPGMVTVRGYKSIVVRPGDVAGKV